MVTGRVSILLPRRHSRPLLSEYLQTVAPGVASNQRQKGRRRTACILRLVLDLLCLDKEWPKWIWRRSDCWHMIPEGSDTKLAETVSCGLPNWSSRIIPVPQNWGLTSLSGGNKQYSLGPNKRSNRNWWRPLNRSDILACSEPIPWLSPQSCRSALLSQYARLWIWGMYDAWWLYLDELVSQQMPLTITSGVKIYAGFQQLANLYSAPSNPGSYLRLANSSGIGVNYTATPLNSALAQFLSAMLNSHILTLPVNLYANNTVSLYLTDTIDSVLGHFDCPLMTA